jgi:hypothetical protein
LADAHPDDLEMQLSHKAIDKPLFVRSMGATPPVLATDVPRWHGGESLEIGAPDDKREIATAHRFGEERSQMEEIWHRDDG